MNEDVINGGHFALLGTPFSISAAIAVVLLTACLGLIAWRRSGYARAHGFLEALRLAIVSLVALLLNQPEWVEEYQPTEKPAIAVIWDDSRSMQTRDVVLDPTSPAEPVTRAEAIKPLVGPAIWLALSDQYEVVLQPITRDDVGTDLSTALIEVAREVSPLAGSVLISDGDWNEGIPPVDAASQYRIRNVPIFTVTAGSPTRLPDIDLTSVALPTFGAVDKPIRIPFTIESSLPREYVTPVTLTLSNGEVLKRDVRIEPMGRTSDSFNWLPETTGDYTVSVSIPIHPDERIDENNQRSAPIVIRQEQLKVLIVESFPRWEYRYLRNALSRDPGVAVSCLLFHPELEEVGGGSTDYVKVFPEAIEDLATYDVVFLGDVGLDDGQLTEQQCELIKGLVEFQASGLVFIPGLFGRQFTLTDTKLSELYPVVLDEGQPGGWGSRTPGHFELTERGRGSLLTKLADSEADNAQVWEDLPGFQWYSPVIRAKAGTEVLAVHGDMSNQYGRLPLLVTRTFGSGKVLFMGTDGAWRWRKGVEDKYHYRFWGQVVRWMAYQRNMSKGESMRLFYSPDQPQLKQTLTFSAHVMDDSGEPMQSGQVAAQVIAPSGEIETVQLLSQDEKWGVFEGRYTTTEPGKHSVIVTNDQTEAMLETSLFVQGDVDEPIGKPARPDVMEEIAFVSRGKAVQPDEIDDVIQALTDLPKPAPTIHRVQLWSHPLSGVLVVLLLGAFWVMRKYVGLF